MPSQPTNQNNLSNLHRDKKDKLKKTLAIAGGFIAGAAGNAVLLQNVEAISAEELLALFKQDNPEKEPEQVAATWVIPNAEDEIKIASNISNALNFSAAFEQARNEVGAGGIFVWHGQLYNTFSAAEWNTLPQDKRETYFDDVDVNQFDLTYEELKIPQSKTLEPLQDKDDQSIYNSLKVDKTNNEDVVEEKTTDAVIEEDGNEQILTVVAEEQTVEPETFAIAPTIEEISILPDDVNAPKIHESLVDTDGDHKADGLKIDFENDKISDVILVDLDNNAVPEKIYYDTDNDAKQDIVVYDANEDGKIDGADPLGDTPADNFDINNPDKNDFDNASDVSAWQEENK